MTCRWHWCRRTDIVARGLCVRHYRRATVDGRLDEYPTRGQWADQPLVCRCTTPAPDPIGECQHCHRLDPTTLRREMTA